MHEKLYRTLLKLYPRNFRSEYGQAMTVHFRDQLRDARRAQSQFWMARFWFRIGMDTLLSAARARSGRKFGNQSEEGNIMKTSLLAAFFIACLLPLLGHAMARFKNEPVAYVAKSFLLLEPEGMPRNSIVDPKFVAAQIAVFVSDQSLAGVARELNLSSRLSKSGETITNQDELLRRLRGRIGITPSQKPPGIWFAVMTDESGLSINIAQSLIKKFRQKSAGITKVTIVGPPTEQPARKLAPSLVAFTPGMSLLLAAVGAWGLWRLRSGPVFRRKIAAAA